MKAKIPDYLPSLGRLLEFAARNVHALSEQRLAPHGLTLAQWVVLTALWRHDRMTVGELARYYRSSNVVLTRTLDRMSDRSLIEREADPRDRRVVRVKLTEKARGLSHLVDFYKDINQTIVQGLSAQEQATLIHLLERVNLNSEAALNPENENQAGKERKK